MIRRGYKVEMIEQITGVDKWFINKFKWIVEQEEKLKGMKIEDLNKEIQEEHTDPELIREALKEAVFNRKTNWNYIKGVLRNWKLSGITTKIQVEERRLEHQGKKQHHQVSDEFKTGMDAARQLWGGQ